MYWGEFVLVNCPYDQKEQAKAMGGRWVSAKRVWAIPMMALEVEENFQIAKAWFTERVWRSLNREAVNGKLGPDDFMFLSNPFNAKSADHIWVGNDTLCRLYSTGGIRNDAQYQLVKADPKMVRLCTMCYSSFQRRKGTAQSVWVWNNYKVNHQEEHA